uniref:Uncharacterized protein n=1 Tax=mine drainage metagenome TaxID=410659 RepID=E6PV51_9ZZZZ
MRLLICMNATTPPQAFAAAPLGVLQFGGKGAVLGSIVLGNGYFFENKPSE